MNLKRIIGAILMVSMAFSIVSTPYSAMPAQNQTVFTEDENQATLENGKIKLTFSKANLEVLQWLNKFTMYDYAASIKGDDADKNILLLKGKSGIYPATSNSPKSLKFDGNDKLTVEFDSDHPDFKQVHIKIVYNMPSDKDYYSREITVTDNRGITTLDNIGVIDNKIDNISGTGIKNIYGLSTTDEIKTDSNNIAQTAKKSFEASYFERDIFSALTKTADSELSVPGFVISDSDGNGYYVMSDADYGMNFDFIDKQNSKSYGTRHTNLPMRSGVCTERKILLIDGLIIDYQKPMEVITNYRNILDVVSPLAYTLMKQETPITCLYHMNAVSADRIIGEDPLTGPLSLIDTDSVMFNWHWPALGEYYTTRENWPSYAADAKYSKIMTRDYLKGQIDKLHNAGYKVGTYNNPRESSEFYNYDIKSGNTNPRVTSSYNKDFDISGPVGWEGTSILDPRTSFTQSLYEQEIGLFDDYGYDFTLLDRNDHRTIKQGAVSMFPELQDISSGWLANITALKYKKTNHYENGRANKGIYANVVPFIGAYSLVRYSDAMLNETEWEDVSLFKLQSMLPAYRFYQNGHFGVKYGDEIIYKPFFAGGLVDHYDEYDGFDQNDIGASGLTWERAIGWRKAINKNNLSDALKFISTRTKQISYDDSDVYSSNSKIIPAMYLYEDGTKILIGYNDSTTTQSTFITTPDGIFQMTVEGGEAGYKMLAAALPIIVDNSNENQFTLKQNIDVSISSEANMNNHIIMPSGSGNMAEFTAVTAKSGEYEVFARWIEDAGRSESVIYEITDKNGKHTVKINQKTDGSSYISLGNYSFDSTHNPIIAVQQSESGTVSVDSVKLNFKGGTRGEDIGQVLSNPKTTNGVYINNGVNIEKTQNNHYYRIPSNGNAAYDFNVPVKGVYEVYTKSVATKDISEKAKISVEHLNGITSTFKNQSRFSGEWILVGEYVFEKSGKLTIESADGKEICADSIMVVPTGMVDLETTTSSVTFNGEDRETRGLWRNSFGSLGYSIPSVGSNFNDCLSIGVDSSVKVFTSDSQDASHLDNADGTKKVNAAYISPTVDVWFSGSQPVDISLYFNTENKQTVEIYDYMSGKAVTTQAIENSSGGVYLKYSVKGRIKIKITSENGEPQLAGIFAGGVNPLNEAEFYSIDKDTRGSWIGSYGNEGYYILGENDDIKNLPDNFSVSVENGFKYTFGENLDDTRAIQKPDKNGNLATSIYNFEPIIIKTVSNVERYFTLYTVDWDNLGRETKIEAIDDDTGKVIASYDLTSYEKSSYITFKTCGNITYRLSKLDTDEVRNNLIYAFFVGKPTVDINNADSISVEIEDKVLTTSNEVKAKVFAISKNGSKIEIDQSDVSFLSDNKDVIIDNTGVVRLAQNARITNQINIWAEVRGKDLKSIKSPLTAAVVNIDEENVSANQTVNATINSSNLFRQSEEYSTFADFTLDNRLQLISLSAVKTAYMNKGDMTNTIIYHNVNIGTYTDEMNDESMISGKSSNVVFGSGVATLNGKNDTGSYIEYAGVKGKDITFTVHNADKAIDNPIWTVKQSADNAAWEELAAVVTTEPGFIDDYWQIQSYTVKGISENTIRIYFPSDKVDWKAQIHQVSLEEQSFATIATAKLVAKEAIQNLQNPQITFISSKEIESGNIYESYDFSENPLFEVLEGKYNIENGVLKVNSTGAVTQIAVGSSSYTDYTVSARLKVISGNDPSVGVGIRGHYIADVYQGKPRIYNRVNNDIVSPFGSSVNVYDNEWHDFKLKALGNEYSLYIDGELTNRGTYGESSSGKAILFAYDSEVWFDDLVISDKSEADIRIIEPDKNQNIIKLNNIEGLCIGGDSVNVAYNGNKEQTPVNSNGAFCVKTNEILPQGINIITVKAFSSNNHVGSAQISVLTDYMVKRYILDCIPATVNLPVNTDVGALGLPKQMNVRLDNNSNITVDVSWDTSVYDKTKVGNQILYGEFVNLPEGVGNILDIKASANVTLNPADAKKGDVNGDGVCNIIDLVVLKKIVAEVKDKNTAADINNDGSVNSIDLSLLKKLLLE